MTTVPSRLQHDTIVDCLLELRFRPASAGASDLLPGLLYRDFGKEYPKLVQTPEAQLPRQARELDQSLRTRPTMLLQGSRGHIGIADEAIQLRFTKPYPRWDGVRPEAARLFGAFHETNVAENISRVSVAYTNIITTGRDEFDLAPLAVNVVLPDGLERRGAGTSLRFEVERDDTISVVQVQSGAKAVLRQGLPEEETLLGLLFRIDTISTSKIGNLDELMIALDNVHEREKEVYFGLLTKETTNELGPIWS